MIGYDTLACNFLKRRNIQTRQLATTVRRNRDKQKNQSSIGTSHAITSDTLWLAGLYNPSDLCYSSDV